MALHVIPDGTGLVVVFGVNGSGRPHDAVVTGGLRAGHGATLSPVSRGYRGFHPFIGIGIDQPAMSVGRVVGVYVKVVGRGKTLGEHQVVEHHRRRIYGLISGFVGEGSAVAVTGQRGLSPTLC